MFTGSVMVPAGADAMLLQEDAERDGEQVRVHETVARRPPDPPRRARISPLGDVTRRRPGGG